MEKTPNAWEIVNASLLAVNLKDHKHISMADWELETIREELQKLYALKAKYNILKNRMILKYKKDDLTNWIESPFFNGTKILMSDEEYNKLSEVEE